MSIPKQDERTPGPWHQDGFFIQDDNGHLIAIVESPDGRCDEANARFIVQAVNAYTSTEALREALWQLLDDMGDDGLSVCQAAKDQARAALSGSPAPSEWRDIETAPKDGTEIIGLIKWPYDKAAQRRIIYWSHSGNCVIPAYMNTWMCAVTTLSQREDYIQGWQPLPPAPDAARTALAGVTAPVEEQ